MLKKSSRVLSKLLFLKTKVYLSNPDTTFWSMVKERMKNEILKYVTLCPHDIGKLSLA